MLDLEGFREVARSPWRRVSNAHVGLGWGVGLLLVLVYARGTEGWVPILDSLNLVFHEAGHPLFGIFGETVGALGGTLMQLLVPLLVLGSSWMKRQPLGAALAGVWAFQNLLNIARYVADARAQVLPLVGGGEHDWAFLLGQWGLLSSDLSIAAALRVLAWIGMLGSLGWLSWRWSPWRQAGPMDEGPSGTLGTDLRP